jgi:hypothetical protein
VDVTKIIASSPHLLTFDIEQNIGPKIRQLKHLLPGRPPFPSSPLPLTFTYPIPQAHAIEEKNPHVDYPSIALALPRSPLPTACCA